MSDITAVLQAAIDGGKTVTIVYNGGSRPGQPRVIVPLSILGDSLVAKEPPSQTRKTYKLSKVASATLLSGEFTSNPTAIPIALRFETLLEYATHLGPTYRAAGWHVSESDDCFSLGTFFKNGKPKKTPSISIQYFDPSLEIAYDIDTGVVSQQTREVTGRERPWRVDSWRQPQGKSFSLLQSAMSMFVEEVQASDPLASSTIRS